MSTDIRLPHRGNAYQPRATLWVCHAPNPRVLKERRISPNDGREPDQPLCGVPSERIHCERQRDRYFVTAPERTAAKKFPIINLCPAAPMAMLISNT